MTSPQEHFFAERVLPAVAQIEQWRPLLVTLLTRLDRASNEEWQSETFLRDLWASEAVSNTGQGSVSVEAALTNETFRDWFATAAQDVRRLTGAAQIDALKVLFDRLIDQFRELGLTRMPRLKINRVLAALAPTRLTTLANPGTREGMYRWATSTSPRGIHPVDQQVAIREAFNIWSQQYPQLKDSEDLTTFMLPWVAYERLTDTREPIPADSAKKTQPGSNRKSPDNIQTKTFIAVGDGIRRLFEICDMVASEPMSEDDFYESLQERYPWNYPWAKQVANFLANSVGILTRDDATFRISSLGTLLLQRKSGDVLAEQLIRNFIGVDHVLVELKDDPRPKAELVRLLRRVNPKAKSDFLPNTTLSWLTFLGAIELNKGEYSLTPSGITWGELVQWTPTISQANDQTAPDIEEEAAAVETETPKWEQIAAHFLTQAASDGISFNTSDIFELHKGLWHDAVRHFCVLTGLSGSGKTQMALRYANAVVAAGGGDESCVAVIPVQPDWAEPSHLLGFRHPLDSTRYQTTQFLEILLRAHANPTTPHFVILDEMNLAHPELYLAPILSAMETEGSLWLRETGDDGSQTVPASVRYPRNLAIIGTINMDETTHSLSDKVLDRANVIQFSNVDLDTFPWSAYALLGDRLPEIRGVLIKLHDALLPVRLHFAYRVVKSIVSQVAFAVDQLEQGAVEDWLVHFDSAIGSKILPKFRGEDSTQLRFAMERVHAILTDAKLEKSANGVNTLRAELAQDGVLKFWR